MLAAEELFCELIAFLGERPVRLVVQPWALPCLALACRASASCWKPPAARCFPCTAAVMGAVLRAPPGIYYEALQGWSSSRSRDALF